MVGRRATSICLGRLPHQERPRIPRASITSSSYRAHRVAPRRASLYTLRAHARLHAYPSSQPPFFSFFFFVVVVGDVDGTGRSCQLFEMESRHMTSTRYYNISGETCATLCIRAKGKKHLFTFQPRDNAEPSSARRNYARRR